MQEIVKTYEVINHEEIVQFLKGVTTLNCIDDNLLKHGVYLYRADELIGMVSYELFDKVGMIRYFIFNQTVTSELIINLFFRLYYEAKEAGVKQLVSVATTDYASQLFELLGFTKTTDPSLVDGITVNKEGVSIVSIDLEKSVSYDAQSFR